MGDGLIVPFRWTQLTLAVLHIGSALVVTLYLASQPLHKNIDWPVDVSARYNVWAAPGKLTSAKDVSCGEEDAGCRIFTIEEEPTKFSLGYTAACFSFISGLHHLAVALAIGYPQAFGTSKTQPATWYARCLKDSVFPLRWADYAITSGLMFAVLTALFEAPISLDVVVFAFCFQFLVIVAGAGSEYIWSREPYIPKAPRVAKGKWSDSLYEFLQPIQREKKDGEPETSVGWPLFLRNAFVYTVFGTPLGVISVVLNALAILLFLDSFFDRFKILRGIRDITRKQVKTISTTPHGLVFLCSVLPYVVVFSSIFYKFYLATIADDEDNLKSIMGIAVPKGIRPPPDVVWIAIFSIFVTFSSFAVCHINKISLADPKNLRDTIKYETVYSFLSFTSKIILLFNIFAGITMRGESDTQPAYATNFDPATFENTTIKRDGDDERLSAPNLSLIITVSISVILGILSYYMVLVKKHPELWTLNLQTSIGGLAKAEAKNSYKMKTLVF